MPENQPEPWLRGRIHDLPAVHLAVSNALQLASENIDHWCSGLSNEDFHSEPYALPPIAFHIRHIARSLDRLLTYAEGDPLSDSQLRALNSESDSTGSATELLEEFQAAINTSAVRIGKLTTISLELPRTVGRQHLPTTIGGLLVHIADHTQRHTGQIITTAKLLQALRALQRTL